ncbi:hypothetical protein HX837_08420, partial [Marine Group I thaumarchaeote]|nr:hypothetical protein [Marine Group I thaumarchaeote]
MTVTLLLLSIGIISANTLSLEANGDGTWNVNFTSDADIGGFQFDVDDVTVNGASGGEAAANGFIISSSSTTVLGFSLSGTTIPAGSGTLVVVNVTGIPSGLSGIVMSDAVGNQLDFTYLPSEGDGPADFAFNSSILQAFYFFNLVLINDIEVDPNDWVGAFNGETCVGARKWDTSLCGNGICDVPVMGDDDSEVTVGYMNTGEFPTFKIYDASEDNYYIAVSSNEIPWEALSLNMSDSLNGYIWGCTDINACNYNADATMDDGNCLEIDCAGECGGDGLEEGFSCDGIPLEFAFNHSSLQAFYYIYEASDMAGNPLTAEDWVGAFNGDMCVGSRQWDTSLCNNGICDVPAMGDDGYDYSEGYLLPGDLPSFKIYDYSEGDYFDAYPSENYPYENAGIFNINELVLDLSYSIPLSQYNNLMSFNVLPEDVTVGNVMLDIQENIV